MSVGKVINDVSRALVDLPGIVGVVLGGSRARGTNRPDSDIDIGIYYDVEDFDVSAVGEAALKLDDEHRDNLVSSLGEWGPWINGGGWLIVEGYHVDLIFRDVHRVEQVIEDGLRGHVSSHYHTGHPHAFLNVMYMGEIAISKILTDPMNKLSVLKEKAMPYPNTLKKAIVEYFMFEASFSNIFADDNVDKNDAYYVSGHVFRSISCLNQVLFALNEEYCINEKKAVAVVDRFEVKPAEYKDRIDEIVSLISADEDDTRKGVNLLKELVSDIERLV
ncbi:DNA polymerase subunit beta [Virgibacillus indicus]|uniref:DNA polymerase subunit beta n=1 Tax=Virgibacillus indicus TaxID=2024554 RepID=A0A265N5Z0_9BACI|nr:nucleotidyltransferase domain-containing protein [Virgibacillus indicus]OZU87443.1 DNA polymerase subunit beta [Virgibacillus indicus]